MRLFEYIQALDMRLRAVSRRMQYLGVAAAVLFCAAVGIVQIPRPFLNFSNVPLLHRIHQHPTYGTDTISDLYESRVVLNDVQDMYTKAHMQQTSLEAATWTKAASGPYPPAALLVMASLYELGGGTARGFYGVILALACVFLLGSAVYSLMTRWYVFPLTCASAWYLANRFVYVQDDSYLIMLTVVLAALFLARSRAPAAHLLMAVAISIKLSPLYYLKNVTAMKRGTAALMVAIVVAGLVLPYFVWNNYLYIYAFQAHRKSQYWLRAVGALALVVPFAVTLWYVESRVDFDMEDRVGWGLVPFALLMAITMNAPRHLLVALLVPDKRAARTAAGAVGLGLHYAFPRLVSFGVVLYLTTGLLSLILAYYLQEIGWTQVRTDLRHPLRTARVMLA